MQIMEFDLVSVILATHNPKPDFLRKSLESICKQSYPRIEIIIVDDGSALNVDDMVMGFDVSRPYKVIKLDGQSGLAKALNVGIKVASGKYIARLDDDDLSAENRIEEEINVFIHNPKAVCVFTAVEVIDGAGKAMYQIIHKFSSVKKIENYLAIKGNPFCHSSAMFLKSVIDGIGGYNPLYTYAQDYELWLKLSKIGEIRYIPKVMTFWRSVDGNKTIQKEALQTAFCEAARYDAYLRNRTIGNTFIYLMSRFYCTAQIVLLKSKQKLSG